MSPFYKSGRSDGAGCGPAQHESETVDTSGCVRTAGRGMTAPGEQNQIAMGH